MLDDKGILGKRWIAILQRVIAGDFLVVREDFLAAQDEGASKR